MTKMPRWLRALIPAILIVGWLAIGGVGGPYFGKINQVSSNDQTSYLPASADSTRVQNLQVKFASQKAIPAIVVFVRDGGLTDADTAFIDQRIEALKTATGV